ncbi:MAG: hypothetical protein OEZ34_04240 [Spirochaetia bacterium]|nr:hypothetical protein [Spirochaetia bacterium]
MGVYYHYANHTKKERFAADSLGGSPKLRALGYTLASRAFHLLLASPHGRWLGDNISILGDDIEKDWDIILKEYTDIQADVILMLIQKDGTGEICSIIREDENLFMQMCYLVITGQTKHFRRDIEPCLGAEYQKRYGQLCKETQLFYPKDLTFFTIE